MYVTGNVLVGEADEKPDIDTTAKAMKLIMPLWVRQATDAMEDRSSW